ncbi:MAG TPA: hypothetical protein DEA55_10840 [Rhodospirillaceae bacterium]|nr:hypothetical protein [Rhodospirillaceae bacterium]
METPKITGDFDNEIQEALYKAHFTNSEEDWLLVRTALRNAGYPFSPEHTPKAIYAFGYMRQGQKELETCAPGERGKIFEKSANAMEWISINISPIEKALCKKNINMLVEALQLAGHNIKHPQNTSLVPGSDGPVFS